MNNLTVYIKSNHNNNSNGVDLINLNETNYEEFLLFVTKYIDGILGGVLFVIGLILNILSFAYFQFSRSFRGTTLRHYFRVLSISDSIRLSEWLFAVLATRTNLFEITLVKCRLIMFSNLTSGQISVWLLVFLSIERFIILQFPVRGKQFYTTKTSLIILVCVICFIVGFNLPYVTNNVIVNAQILENYSLLICMPDNSTIIYRYNRLNNIYFYSFIPFMIVSVFNILLIYLLARRKRELKLATQTNSGQSSSVLNLKRERHFKERTILLLALTILLVFTVSPRFIAQFKSYKNYMVFLNTKSEQNARLFQAALVKTFIQLEFMNFSFNFIFYILCSRTSRKEFFLILYYFFYWKWSQESKTTIICNHVKHNERSVLQQQINNEQQPLQHSQSIIQRNSAVTASSIYFKSYQTKTISRVYCFLNYKTRSLNRTQNTNNTNASTYTMIRQNSNFNYSTNNRCRNLK
jgi:hypothetical protein